MYFKDVHYSHSPEVGQGQLSDLHFLPKASLGTVPVLREALQALLPDLKSTLEFERRRAEPDSFVSRVLSQPILPLLGEIKGVVDEPA